MKAFDTTTPTGKLLFNMLASIAEFETAIRAERQAEGIAKAQAKSVQFGAKPKVKRRTGTSIATEALRGCVDTGVDG